MTVQPWLKSYPPDVRIEAPLDLSSVQSVLEKAAERFGSQPALEFMGKRTSYAELEALANRAAAGFQKARRRPGRARRPLPAQHAPLHDRLLRRPESRRRGRQLFAARRTATLQIKIEDSETDILVTLDLAALYPQAEKLLASTRLKTTRRRRLRRMSPAPAPVKALHGRAGDAGGGRPDERHVAFRDLLDNDGRYQVHPIGDPARRRWRSSQYTGGTTGRRRARC